MVPLQREVLDVQEHSGHSKWGLGRAFTLECARAPNLFTLKKCPMKKDEVQNKILVQLSDGRQIHPNVLLMIMRRILQKNISKITLIKYLNELDQDECVQLTYQNTRLVGVQMSEELLCSFQFALQQQYL